jgi:hypothetical protein
MTVCPGYCYAALGGGDSRALDITPIGNGSCGDTGDFCIEKNAGSYCVDSMTLLTCESNTTTTTRLCARGCVSRLNALTDECAEDVNGTFVIFDDDCAGNDTNCVPLCNFVGDCYQAELCTSQTGSTHCVTGWYGNQCMMSCVGAIDGCIDSATCGCDGACVGYDASQPSAPAVFCKNALLAGYGTQALFCSDCLTIDRRATFHVLRRAASIRRCAPLMAAVSVTRPTHQQRRQHTAMERSTGQTANFPALHHNVATPGLAITTDLALVMCATTAVGLHCSARLCTSDRRVRSLALQQTVSTQASVPMTVNALALTHRICCPAPLCRIVLPATGGKVFSCGRILRLHLPAITARTRVH